MKSSTRHRMPTRIPGLLTALATALCSTATTVVLVLSLGAMTSACDKPKEADCKKAVANIRQLYETQGHDFGVNPKAMIRSCRGSANRESVQCFIAAQSIADLHQCEGGKFDEMFGAEAQPTESGTQDTPTPGATTQPAVPIPGTEPTTAPAAGSEATVTPTSGAGAAPETTPAAGTAPATGADPTPTPDPGSAPAPDTPPAEKPATPPAEDKAPAPADKMAAPPAEKPAPAPDEKKAMAPLPAPTEQ